MEKRVLCAKRESEDKDIVGHGLEQEGFVRKRWDDYLLENRKNMLTGDVDMMNY